jgi:hypothetical protein
MAMDAIGKIGILWRGDRATRDESTAENNRLRPLFEALAALKVAVEPVVFHGGMVEEVRAELERLDGVLVWVDPIMGSHDRSKLDGLLRDVSSKGVWVSAHPDVILKMGTKEVLFLTRRLGWGADTYLYHSEHEFKTEFPLRLASAGPRVLKQHRGNAGIGVWKVELPASAARAPAVAPRADATVRVQHAHPRDTVIEELPLTDFMERCQGYFTGGGRIVDQPFQPRIVDGMIRCYMVRDEVVGFAHQSPDPATRPVTSTAPHTAEGPASRNVFGLPAKKTMYEATEPRFASLRSRMEREWLPAMQRLVDVDEDSLPLLWDADFLYGPKTEAGDDTYILCEINVSSVYPFPDAVVGKLALAVVTRLTSLKSS